MAKVSTGKTLTRISAWKVFWLENLPEKAKPLSKGG
jgi:hypothetical protein